MIRVTEKGRLGDERQRAGLPGPLLALALGSAMSLVWFGLSVAGYTPLHYDNLGAATVNAFWVVVNLLLIMLAIARVRSLQYGTERRSGFRFATNLSGVVASQPCRIQDISMTGALLSITSKEASEQPGVAGRLQLEIDLAHETVTLAAEVCSRRADGPNRAIYGVQFCDGQTQVVGRLALALANAWVEEAQPEASDDRPNRLRQSGERVWRAERAHPQLTRAAIEAEAVG